MSEVKFYPCLACQQGRSYVRGRDLPELAVRSPVRISGSYLSVGKMSIRSHGEEASLYLEKTLVLLAVRAFVFLASSGMMVV